jgi:hypothetical protein
MFRHLAIVALLLSILLGAAAAAAVESKTC